VNVDLNLMQIFVWVCHAANKLHNMAQIYFPHLNLHTKNKPGLPFIRNKSY